MNSRMIKLERVIITVITASIAFPSSDPDMDRQASPGQHEALYVPPMTPDDHLGSRSWEADLQGKCQWLPSLLLSVRTGRGDDQRACKQRRPGSYPSAPCYQELTLSSTEVFSYHQKNIPVHYSLRVLEILPRPCPFGLRKQQSPTEPRKG